MGQRLIVFCAFVQALRVSMEEQRQRQEEEARRAAAASAAEAGMPTPTVDGKKRIGKPLLSVARLRLTL